MATPSGEVAQTLTSATSKQGLNREVWAALLRVGTRLEFPEDNLRELTTQIVGYPGREKTKNSPTKGSNLMHSLALSKNKGLSEYQRRATQLRTGPSPLPRGGREAAL